MYVKIEGLKESILVLVDHGFEINILSKKVYKKDKWPIEKS